MLCISDKNVFGVSVRLAVLCFRVPQGMQIHWHLRKVNYGEKWFSPGDAYCRSRRRKAAERLGSTAERLGSTDAWPPCSKSPSDGSDQCLPWNVSPLFCSALCTLLSTQQDWDLAWICCLESSISFLREMLALLFWCGTQLSLSLSLLALYRKFTLQSKMNILGNCLLFTLLYFYNTCTFLIEVSGMPLSPGGTKLEGGRGVIFLRVSALAFLEWNLLFRNVLCEASADLGCGAGFWWEWFSRSFLTAPSSAVQCSFNFPAFLLLNVNSTLLAILL